MTTGLKTNDHNRTELTIMIELNSEKEVAECWLLGWGAQGPYAWTACAESWAVNSANLQFVIVGCRTEARGNLAGADDHGQTTL